MSIAARRAAAKQAAFRFACFLEQFAADRHRAVKGLLGALSDFYEETGGPGRKAFLPTKVAQARHLHKKGTKAAQVKLRHNLDLASFTLSSALEMAAQFSTNPIREHLHGTPGKWEVSLAVRLGLNGFGFHPRRSTDTYTFNTCMCV